MPKIRYQEFKFSPATLAVIKQANAIIAEYAGQGFDLTLRQLYYQFVSRDLIPNRDQEYRRLGSIVSDARLAGLIDWNAIVDRTRNLRSLAHWNSPVDIVDAVAEQFRIDRWATQPYRVEVWIEKDALVGVIEGICNALDVPFFSCRGYTSQSEMWSAGQRLLSYITPSKKKKSRRLGEGLPGTVPRSQTPIILHFGDHDPSGIDMTRDIDERLSLFMGGLEVRRLALNMNQVEQYDPPPNPAKLTDSRCGAYMARFGDESWELDALEPSVLASLIQREIEDLIEPDAWATASELQSKGRDELSEIAGHYNAVQRFLKANF